MKDNSRWETLAVNFKFNEPMNETNKNRCMSV